MEKLEKHLLALKEKHAEYDRLIAEEGKYPYPDDAKIKEYKKHKLALKQEIEEIEKKDK